MDRSNATITELDSREWPGFDFVGPGWRATCNDCEATGEAFGTTQRSIDRALWEASKECECDTYLTGGY
jgi:hypothetical protein